MTSYLCIKPHFLYASVCIMNHPLHFRLISNIFEGILKDVTINIWMKYSIPIPTYLMDYTIVQTRGSTK